MRVLISGYYGFQNAGDEAILYALVRGLRARCPDLDLTVLSADPGHTALRYEVRAVSRSDPRAIARELRAADLFISGGGGLLQDVTSLASLKYYLGLMALARALNRPVFIYAQGVGPLRTGAGRFLARAVLNRVQAVTVRDEESWALLRALGVHRPPVEVTADPVLGLVPEPAWRARGRALLAKAGIREGRPVAGYAVRPWPGPEDYLGAVAGAADELAAAGYQAVFLPFHHPEDLEACRAVADRMRAPAVVLADRLDFSELLGISAHLDLAVGMRLHFLVFAALSGIPLVGLPYDPKVRLFLERLGLPAELRVDRVTPGELRRATAAARAQRESLSVLLGERVAALRAAAERTPALALQIVAGGRKRA